MSGYYFQSQALGPDHSQKANINAILFFGHRLCFKAADMSNDKEPSHD
jgi:hypothetical protein